MTPHFLRSPAGEDYLHEINRDAFVDVDSATAFDRRFGDDFAADDTLHVVIGTDSGLLARWLRDARPGEGSRILFVELDDYHDAIRESLGELGEGVALCRASDWEAALAELDPGRWLYGGRLIVVESIGCAAGYAPGYTALARSLRTRLGELVHAAGARINMQYFIRVQLRNAADNLRPASDVGRIGEGCTAIVLGGGPSLDEHLDWIARHRDGLFVIAASRIVGKLLDVGLRPDVIMAVDPQPLLFDISKRGLELDDVTLVGAHHVCASLLQQWRGPTLYTGRALPWDAAGIDDAHNLVSAGSTVSHAALWLAFQWGFSQILLSGVDLCYAPGGATHASGSLESLCTALPSHYEAQVRTYDGRRAGTAMALKIGRDELHGIGEAVAAAGVALHNLAIRAARVESIEHRATADVVLPATRPELGVRRTELAPEQRLKVVGRELLRARKGLRDVRRGCTEAARCLDGLHGAGGRAPDYRHKRRLDAVDRTLERRSAPWMKLVKTWAAPDLARNVSPSGFDGMSDAELERWGREYYRIVSAAATRLGALVDDAIERVDHRRLELDPSPDAKRLVDYWRRDATLGRIDIVFPAGQANAAGAEPPCLAAARREHAALLNPARTGYETAHTAQKTNPANVLRTIALLFGEGDREDLSLLADGLRSMGAPWTTIALWAAGQLAELDADPGTALERYREVVEIHADLNESGKSPPAGTARLLEDVLIRIVHLQLAAGDGESALAGLSVLAHLSPAYLPRQASLLGLLGRRDEAADLLQSALASGDGNWRTAVQLAELYRDSGADDAAGLADALAGRLRASPSTLFAGDRRHAA